jgi:predicted naringenin-chalcone synthase
MIEGEQEMTWGIGDHGFEMTLSTYIPDLIKKGVKSLIDNLLKTLELDSSQIQHFAIHPGGKKILEVIEAELNISKEDNKHAYQIMKNCGNMSSPTILFVLERIFVALEEKDKNANILGLAFGPGLTLESMILKVS